MQVHFEEKKINLDLNNNIYTLKLNNSIESIPKEYDVTGIDFKLPKEIKEIRLVNNGQIIATFISNDLNDISQFPIYLSLLSTNVELEFEYDNEWLSKNKKNPIYFPKITFNINKIKHDTKNEITVPVKQLRKNEEEQYYVFQNYMIYNNLS